MNRLIPETLAGRTIAILLVGLGLFHLLSMWVYQIGTERLLGMSREQQIADRLASANRTIAAFPTRDREDTAHALSSADMEVHWSPISLVNPAPITSERLKLLEDRLRQSIPELEEDHIRLGYGDEGTIGNRDRDSDRHLMLASVQLPDGSWTNYSIAALGRPIPTQHGALGSLTAMAIGILLVSVVLVRWVTAPLRNLADAADRIGTDLAEPAVAETGPSEVRQAARAFNRMQARIKRLISDRTQTLAAISHDLKTPITRLRLRAQFIRDEDLRQTIEVDLEEMERMLDLTLSFLRGDATQEEVRSIDITTLLETICDRLSDEGHDVTLLADGPVIIRCRPLAVKRAFSNLIDNAVKYGTRAKVSLRDKPEDLIVTIEDDGPGIPEEALEKVFDPFTRLEASRSRETGGTGLGLTVARTAVRSHGGDVVLRNQPGRGLAVTVTLPKIRRH